LYRSIIEVYNRGNYFCKDCLMNTRSRLMLDALRPSMPVPMGYAEGGLVDETTAQDPLSTAPNPFAPAPLRPTYGALNRDIAGLREQRPLFGSIVPGGTNPMMPTSPMAPRPMFGSTGSSDYNFVAPVPQVRTPTAADRETNDFYARQAQLAESIRAADSAQRRATMDAIAQQQFEARMQADLLSPSNYARSGGGGSAAVPVAGSAGAVAGATTSDINRLYRELLGRDADPTGLAANKGASLEVIRRSIMNSAEYKAKNPGAAPASGGTSGGAGADVITQLYRELLGRAPDPTGLAANMGASAETIRQSILNSAEYQAKNAGAAAPSGGGIANIYQQMLGRAPDPTGIAANVGQSDETIRQSIAASPEYQAQNPNIGGIEAVYQELLGRAPDPTGIAANRNASEEEIRQSILASPEYQAQQPAPEEYQYTQSWYNDNTG
jgi:hypothetical protein